MVALDPINVPAPSGSLRVREITTADIRWALREGWRDFLDRRGDALVIGFIYPVVGLLASGFAANRSLVPLVFPLVAGLSLLGPAVAGGFYELARRRESGLDTSWGHFFDPFVGPSQFAIIALGLLLSALFTGWMAVAWGLYQVTLGGFQLSSTGAFLNALFATPEGWALIVFGNLAGLAFAIAALVVSLVSFPMVVDRRGGALAALATSAAACAKNPRAVALWGAIVAILLALGSVPLFAGLAIVLPVLGYATWHLYTRLVVREGAPA